MKMTGGEILLRCLKAENIPYVYGIVGGRFMSFIRAISLDPTVEYIGTRHEAAAAHMAAATFHSTGRLGVCIGDMGPGGGNLISGVASAFNNNIPMLALTSNNPNRGTYPFNGMFMDMDFVNLFKPITKWNAHVKDPFRIPELVRWAVKEALLGRPGPVHLDLAADALTATVEIDEALFVSEPRHYRVTDRSRTTAGPIEAAAELLVNAKKPLLLAGGGVIASEAVPEFRELAHLLRAPATATQMGLGAVSSQESSYIGQGGIIAGHAVVRAMQEADVVLAVGCRFSSWIWDNDGPLVKGKNGQKLIHIDIDPSVIGRLNRIEVGLLGDAKAVLIDLLQSIRCRDLSSIPTERQWTRSLMDTYRSYRQQLMNHNEHEDMVMHPAELAQEIGRHLPEDALVVFDGGHTTFWSNDFTPILKARTRFHDPGMSQLGFGTPYAHAIKMLYPDRPVFNIIGDGSFGFTLQELDTARRYGIRVIHIIHNNGSWGIQRNSQKEMFQYEYGVDLTGTNYAEIAKAFGCYGERISSLEHVLPAIHRAEESGLPAVIDVQVRFEPHPALPYLGAMSTAGLPKAMAKS